jgi:hypothetical protein
MGKLLIVMRGAAGSGKSTKARQLGQGGLVLATDDFWGPEFKPLRDKMYSKKGLKHETVNPEYDFDPNLIGDAHKWSRERALDAISRGVSPIVIDNLNLQAWEAKPYVEAAIAAGYEVRIEQSDDPLWRSFRPGMPGKEKNDLVRELTRRNKHGVPEETIRSMVDRFEHGIGVEDILKAKNPTDVAVEPWHETKAWVSRNCRLVPAPFRLTPKSTGIQLL